MTHFTTPKAAINCRRLESTRLVQLTDTAAHMGDLMEHAPHPIARLAFEQLARGSAGWCISPGGLEEIEATSFYTACESPTERLLRIDRTTLAMTDLLTLDVSINVNLQGDDLDGDASFDVLYLQTFRPLPARWTPLPRSCI